jgi:hypothetical protein
MLRFDDILKHLIKLLYSDNENCICGGSKVETCAMLGSKSV